MTIDVEHFRVLLLEERGRIQSAIAHLHTDHPGSLDDEVDETDNDPTESASATLDREIDYTLEENSTKVLRAIDAALKRIDDGTFGICTNRGEEIDPARLEAYPWASHCIDCKRETEQP
jgi:RNA polymerase-binding transcription factor